VDFDPGVTLAGRLVGFVVGLTGMGGGALMTPRRVAAETGSSPSACTRSTSGPDARC
jgi:hypothetical protein